MKPDRIPLIPAQALTLVLLVATACSPATAAAPTATEVVAPPPSAEIVLELAGPSGAKSFTMEELQALPVTEGQGGFVSSTGKITIPAAFEGVALKDLAAVLGIELDDTLGMTLTAEDGYSMTFSYDQIVNGTFTAYDPATGEELAEHDPLTAIIAYSREGQPLDLREDGTLRLQVVSAKNNQVVDGHWSIKWVTQAEFTHVGEDWSLELEGALTETVDRGSFQSCSSPSCHGSSWEDESAQPWAGVPLWYLIGQVDDENNHGDDGFNEALAASGYKVDIIAADGYIVTLDSQTIQRDSEMLLAFMVNDGELPEKYFPVRLVGPNLQKNEMVGQIYKIVVHVPPISTPTVAAPAPVASPGNLIISGRVGNQMSLSEAGLRAIGAVKVSAEDPKKGAQEFEGVRLATLLNIVQVLPNATKVVFTADDGYQAEIDLVTLAACTDCMIGFTDTPGAFRSVMPGQPSALWVKGLVHVDVQ